MFQQLYSRASVEAVVEVALRSRTIIAQQSGFQEDTLMSDDAELVKAGVEGATAASLLLSPILFQDFSVARQTKAAQSLGRSCMTLAMNCAGACGRVACGCLEEHKSS